MHRLFVALLILVMFCFHAGAIADDLHVDNVRGSDNYNGSPRVDGVPMSGPFKTIARALVSAKMGDRIILADTSVPYRESITLQGLKNSGTSLQPFTIVGNGAVLDGTSAIPHDRWEHHRDNVFKFLPELMHHQQLYLDGKPLERVTPPAKGFLPQLDPRQWCLVNGWIYFCVEDNKIPSQYSLRYARHQVGITLYQVQHVLIQDLTVQGFQLDGINCHDMADEARIVSSTVRGNGRSGISIGGASRVSIDSCLVGDNHTAQVRSEGFCRVNIENSDLIESRSYGPKVMKEGGDVTIDGKAFAEK